MIELNLIPNWAEDSGTAVKPVGDGYAYYAYSIVGNDDFFGDTTLYDIFLAYDNVTVPQGSTIELAQIKFTAKTSESVTTVRTKIFLNDSDDATPPSAADGYADFIALAETTAFTTWEIPAVTAAGEYDTPDFKEVLQEVVNRPGWVSGNTIVVMIKNNGSDSDAFRKFYNRYGLMDPYPALKIQYSFDIPPASMTMTTHAPDRNADVPAATMTLTPVAPSFGSGPYSIPAGSMAMLPRNPTGWWALKPDTLHTAKTIFYCVLTGSDDGLDDLYLPMSSFQARMNDGEPSYLSCVVPNSLRYESDIAARPNGDIVIKQGYRMADGTELTEQIAIANFETIQIDRGSRSDSATIIGHKTVTATAAKDWTISKVSYYALQADGKRRVRADMDLFLRPGDNCIYGAGANDFFTVGGIFYSATADPFRLTMEVSEA